MSYKQDLTGQVFGELTVVKFDGVDKDNKSIWECQCSCGEKVTLDSPTLKQKRKCGPNH